MQDQSPSNLPLQNEAAQSSGQPAPGAYVSLSTAEAAVRLAESIKNAVRKARGLRKLEKKSQKRAVYYDANFPSLSGATGGEASTPADREASATANTTSPQLAIESPSFTVPAAPQPVSSLKITASDFMPTARDFMPTARDFIPTARDFVPTARDIVPTARDFVPTARDFVPTPAKIKVPKIGIGQRKVAKRLPIQKPYTPNPQQINGKKCHDFYRGNKLCDYGAACIYRHEIRTFEQIHRRYYTTHFLAYETLYDNILSSKAKDSFLGNLESFKP